MRIFTLSKNYSVVCNSEKTKYGFRHLASLMNNGQEICKNKACYYNRTWESFEYQSVLRGVIAKHFEGKEKEKYLKIADQEGLKESGGFLKTVGMIAKIGDVLCEKKEEKNTWKKRMMATVPGINFPENFDSLPEEEKARRLDGAIKFLG